MLDHIMVSIFGSPDNIYFLDTRNLNDEQLLPLSEGLVLFKKFPIDLIRLESCELIEMMIEISKKYDGEIEVSLF
jgi:hypothetical protein